MSLLPTLVPAVVSIAVLSIEFAKQSLSTESGYWQPLLHYPVRRKTARSVPCMRARVPAMIARPAFFKETQHSCAKRKSSDLTHVVYVRLS